ncbi:MAG: archaeosine biosynthesis radical SAM protein RaSEA [Candidatus Heimdallarchaeota archaeon]
MSPSLNFRLASTITKLRHEYLALQKEDAHQKLWDKFEKGPGFNTLTVVIPTRGCSWALSGNGGCSMCGYVNDSSRDQPIPSERILRNIRNQLLENHEEKPIHLKIYNSGSFFDQWDVPKNLRDQLIRLIQETPNVFKLSVESKSEYILSCFDLIKEAAKQLAPKELEIGIGLESSNDAIIRDCHNKGTSLDVYNQSVQLLRPLGVRIKTYILIKPPFLTEADSIRDAIQTAIEAAKIGTDIISFSPCTVQSGTLVDFLYRQDRYQPPWLWSVLYIVREIRSLYPSLPIICDPVAAGKPRGAHNCGKCDTQVLEEINRMTASESIPRNLSELSDICTCHYKWIRLVQTPIEIFRSRNLSQLRKSYPLEN